MSIFAKINNEDIVINVINGPENMNSDESLNFISNNLQGTWIETKEDGSIRKNYAGIGYKYDKYKDAFIPPKPEGNYILDEDTCKWVTPSV